MQPQRSLCFRVFRFNPNDRNSAPRYQDYTLVDSDTMTLFMALNEIRDTLDPSLCFDFVCRAGICGSCAMLVNGKPMLACRTLTKDLPDLIHLAPLAGFKLIADLSVDTGTWMAQMAERIESWIHKTEHHNDALNQLETKMSQHTASTIYELERCIECGCCIAACGSAQMHADFIGAVGINQLARFYIDPRDEREEADYYQLLANDEGVFGCMSFLGCEDMCPKQLPLAQQIAYMRKKMALI
ncbi:fumarate reductase iron-sulfur subunit [Thalassotalea aquiviva]|uniref:fumarate reductase iron-sulfur subunit n=1 Tax=Thalassotalea aquiviva TaxID=3242415 RepID=UPI00352AA5DB